MHCPSTWLRPARAEKACSGSVMSRTRVLKRRLALAGAVWLVAAVASAQAYPNAAITLVVGLAPGSGQDVTADHCQAGERAHRRADRDREQAGRRHDDWVCVGRARASLRLHAVAERTRARGQSESLPA